MKNTQVAKNIKMKCQEKNISVAYMLRECGLSATMIYEMEKRDKSPRLDNILKISDFLDCSVDYLTGRTDNPDSHKL